MAKLEEITRGATVRGILPDGFITVVDVSWIGSGAIELTYKDSKGKLGDLQRCLIVCPGNLAEQWQDELYRRFHLPFEIMTNDKYEVARTGNWFAENPLATGRLDKLSRNEDVQEKLKTTDWDLGVCDEAHKMSASFWGGEIRRTKRHQLGQILSALTGHFLLLTATPHNGKEEDFQLFLALPVYRGPGELSEAYDAAWEGEMGSTS